MRRRHRKGRKFNKGFKRTLRKSKRKSRSLNRYSSARGGIRL